MIKRCADYCLQLKRYIGHNMKFTSLNHFLIVIISIGGSYAYTMRDQLSSDITSFNYAINNIKTSFINYGDRVKVAISPLLNNANFNAAVNINKDFALKGFIDTQSSVVLIKDNIESSDKIMPKVK